MSSADAGANSREWKVAQDPKSGRTYYYNARTRETTWNKPLELATPEERRAMIAKKNETIEFFREMERNIYHKIEMARDIDERRAAGEIVDDILYDDFSVEDGTRGRFNSAASSEGTRGLVSLHAETRPRVGSVTGGPPRRIRTISTMDDEVLMTMRQSGGEDRRSSVYARSRTATLNLGEDKLTPMVASTRMARQQSKDAGDKPVTLESLANKLNQVAEPKGPSAQRVQTSPKRRNSTGTIYIANTMSAQDNDATIHCVCVVIRAHMISAARENLSSLPEFDMFKDLAFLRNVRPDANPLSLVPTLGEVKQFFKFIFEKSQLESDCIIMALIYCERLVKETRGKLSIRYDNWRSILFACLVMASKVWDDLSMWNSDFSQVYPSFDLSRVNSLELGMLDALKYVIRVSASEYAKYYFHLRSMMVKLGVGNKDDPNFIKPLDIEGARRLQLSTERFHEAYHDTNGKGNTEEDGGDNANGSNNHNSSSNNNNSNSHNSSGNNLVGRRRHMSLHEGLSTLQRGVTEHVKPHHLPSVSIEQIIHSEHMGADGVVHTGGHAASMKKKSQQNVLSPRK